MHFLLNTGDIPASFASHLLLQPPRPCHWYQGFSGTTQCLKRSVSKPRNWSNSPDFPKKTKRTWKQLSWTPLSFEPWQTCKILQVFGKSNQNSLASRACCSSALSFSKWCISSGIHFNWAVVEELHEASEGKFGSEPSTERWLLTSRFTLLKVWKLNNCWVNLLKNLQCPKIPSWTCWTYQSRFNTSPPFCQVLSKLPIPLHYHRKHRRKATGFRRSCAAAWRRGDWSVQWHRMCSTKTKKTFKSFQ